MNPEQQKSILTVALYAAFADGAKHDREREEIRRIAESLGGEAGAADLSRLYQDVLLKRVSLDAAGVGLTSQYLEQFGRKLLGGLLGKAADKTFGNIGGAATGMAFSFATTYALGSSPNATMPVAA